MAGTAQTSRFMMASATLMLGPLASLYDLQPLVNSVGLVKNVTISDDPTYVDLTQGSHGTTVFSFMTANSVKVTAEVYEFTVNNLAYGLGLDGSLFTTKTHNPYTLNAPTAGTGDTVFAFTTVSGLAVGDTLMFQDLSRDDGVVVRIITAIDNVAKTVTVNHPVNLAMTTTTGWTIFEVNVVPVGSTAVNATYFSAKAAGQLADGTPATILLPKVKVTKGFTMACNSEQFQNMPFEMEVMDMLPTDMFYSDFPNRKGSIYIQ